MNCRTHKTHGIQMRINKYNKHIAKNNNEDKHKRVRAFFASYLFHSNTSYFTLYSICGTWNNSMHHITSHTHKQREKDRERTKNVYGLYVYVVWGHGIYTANRVCTRMRENITDWAHVCSHLCVYVTNVKVVSRCRIVCVCECVYVWLYVPFARCCCCLMLLIYK